MTSVTYADLVTLINNSGLTVGETYKITDYPTFKPELKARTINELWRDGVAGNYKLLYNPFNNDGEYDWVSSKGWVYYLENNLGNSAWCDWVNDASSLFNGTCKNVQVKPYIVSGVFKLPQFSIYNSNNLAIDGDNQSLSVRKCNNCVIGANNAGTLENLNSVTIGDNNTGLHLVNVSSTKIGNGNANVYLNQNVKGIEIGNENIDVNVSGSFNTIGSFNQNVNIQGDANIVDTENIGIAIKQDLNDVSHSKFVEIESALNKVSESNSIVLKNSVGNKINESRSVYLDSVNNNDVWADNYVFSPNPITLPDGSVTEYNSGTPVPFQRVTNATREKVVKVVENMIPRQEFQTDNAGLVINTVNEKTKGSSKSTDSYFIGNDGLWNTEGITTDAYDITLIISKTDSQKVYVSGAGRYLNGNIASIGYSWITPGFEAVFTDEDGTEHTGPFSVIVTESKKYYVSLIEVTPGPVIPVPPDDELWYVTSNDSVLTPYSSSFGARSITSNTYSGGMGVMKFDGNLTEIGNWAFYECSDLTEVYFPNTLTTIGEHTFDGCHLDNLYLNKIESVGYESFDFNNQTTLSIPETLTSIDNNPFRSEHGNLVITVDSNNTVYTDGGGKNCIYNPSTYTLVTGGPNTVIPNDCTTLGGWSFSECYDLTTIEIPASVTYLDRYAFACDGTGSLQELIVHNNPSIGYDCFMNQATGGVLKYTTGVDPSQWLSHLPSGWTPQAI